MVKATSSNPGIRLYWRLLLVVAAFLSPLLVMCKFDDIRLLHNPQGVMLFYYFFPLGLVYLIASCFQQETSA